MNPFGVQKLSAFGTFGEFSLGAGGLRAKYILTKMRPGASGDWECQLASQMVPWREVFKVEELSFDELLQRDLDDSRVAHDLIPYLLGTEGEDAKFFPPILAVIAPRKDGQTGIKPAYPKFHESGVYKEKMHFGNLFDFEQMYWPGVDGGQATPTPLAKLSYNPQQAAFIIVDGQHRAMAILALHRQLNSSWKGSAFASYYDHIQVRSEQVKDIELPVCIIFFPDIQEGSPLVAQGSDLKRVCRDIFLVVNKNAKPVTESRQVLLEDEDLAAWMMRQTLSGLKGRPATDYSLSRIYSIAYGDSDTDLGKQVAHGQLEYSTAIALFKMHGTISFGRPDAFTWNSSIDITDGRNTRNSNRPAEILLGTEVEHHGSISRKSGKVFTVGDVNEIVNKLGTLADEAIRGLFDGFRPFVIHNGTLMRLKDQLADAQIQADTVQKKCQSLIFEGSGIRNVFESHVARLKGIRDELLEEGKTPDDRLVGQITFCDAVNKAMSSRETDVHRARAAEFFQIDRDYFYKNASPDDQAVLDERARKIYQTVSTQAFQLGFAMAVFATVEELKRKNLQPGGTLRYDDRAKLVRFVVRVFVAGLNRFFTPDEASKHRTLSGFFKEPRAGVFDAATSGLRGLYAMQGGELNERQWPFFRYLILELIHSKAAWPEAVAKMGADATDMPGTWYLQTLPGLIPTLVAERQKYVQSAIKSHVEDRQFTTLLEQRKYTEKGAGKQDEEIEGIIQELIQKRTAEAQGITDAHLKASLGANETTEAMLQRILAQMPGASPSTPDTATDAPNSRITQV